jgi:hypothetical protein
MTATHHGFPPATLPAGCPDTPAALRAWTYASSVSARYFGLPVYLVGGALVDKDPRDVDLVVPLPDELFAACYGDGPWSDGWVAREVNAWAASRNWPTPAAVWRRWARDCAKQSRHLTLLVGRAVDFKTQPEGEFARHAEKARVRLDCGFMEGGR